MITLCGCEAHQNNLGVCTCLCDGHDSLFEGGIRILRQAARDANKRIYDLQQDMGQAHEAIGSYSKDLVNIFSSKDLVNIYSRLRGVEDELKRVNERLSPFEKVRADLEGYEPVEPVEATLEVAEGEERLVKVEEGLSYLDQQREAMVRAHDEHGEKIEALRQYADVRLAKIEERLSPPEKEAMRDLPPDCWDRDGVQWTAKRYQRVPGRTTDDILWEALFPDSRRPGYERIAQMLGENLEALRGPITWAERSKDEIALPADKWDRFGIRWSATRAVWHDGRGDVEWMSSKPIGGGATRPAVMTGTELEARGPFTETSPLAEDQEPDPDAGKDTDAVPEFDLSTKAGRLAAQSWMEHDAAMAMVTEESDGDTDAQPGDETKEPGLWSEPWVPDFDGSEPEDRLMFFATMSALWDATSSPKDEDRLRWIGGSLVAWIGRKYHVYDQPDENGVDWRMRATAAETELAIAREQETETETESEVISRLRDRAERAEGEVRDLRRALGELRADFIRIHAIAGQHAAYEGSKETP